MSAAASGFPVSYRVIAPTQADLDNLESGSFLHQENRLRGSAQPQFSNWYVRHVGDLVLIYPLRALWLNDPRRISPSAIKSDFDIKRRNLI